MSCKHDHVCMNAHVHRTSTMSNQKHLTVHNFMQHPSNDMSAQIDICKTQTEISKISLKNAKEKTP